MSVYTEEHVAILDADKAIPARLFEMQFKSETVRVWDGHVNREFGGFTWQGMRGLIDAEAVAFPRTGENKTLVFTIRGLPEAIEDLMWDQEEEVYGRNLIEYCQILAGDAFEDHRRLEPVGPMIGSIIYVMRGLQSTEVGSSEDGSAERVYDLSLMVELLTATRSEASFGRYSPADQSARYPAIVDNIFSDVPSIARGQTIKLF